jgi:hypothetical protein
VQHRDQNRAFMPSDTLGVALLPLELLADTEWWAERHSSSSSDQPPWSFDAEQRSQANVVFWADVGFLTGHVQWGPPTTAPEAAAAAADQEEVEEEKRAEEEDGSSSPDKRDDLLVELRALGVVTRLLV